MMADLGQRRLTDAELLEALMHGINSFPPSHPDAEGMSATQYEVALELRKARAVEAAAHPQPVLVSERLPGPEDCDALGCNWWHDRLNGAWVCCDKTYALRHGFIHWLPAHALPVPGEVES